MQWILWILILGFVWFILSHVAEVSHVAHAMAQGDLRWILLALVVQAAYFAAFTEIYGSALRAVGVGTRFRRLVPIVFASLFVNVAAPTAGAGGTALFVDDAVRRGESGARAAAGAMLALAADLGAFLLILIVGLAYLFHRHDLRSYELLAAGVVLCIVSALTAPLLLGLWRPSVLRWILDRAQRAALYLGRLVHRPHLVAKDWAEVTANEFGDAATAIAERPWRLAQTIATALVAHALDLATLYVLFLAFGHPVGFGVLIAGYAIGILFWIVAITPQGIGVVEGAMTLVYASMGVPTPIAAAVAIAFRGVTFWIPLVIGFFASRRLAVFRPTKHDRSSIWSVHAVAIFAALMGVVNVLSAIQPALRDRLYMLEGVIPFEARHGARLAAALAGFGLLVLAGGLWRRKYVAWALTTLLLIVSVVSHLLKGLDYEEAALATCVALLLIRFQPLFQARSDPPKARQALRALVFSALFVLAYGTIGFYTLDRHFKEKFNVVASAEQTIVMFGEFYDPHLRPLTHHGLLFARSIYTLGAVSLGYCLLMLLRPVLLRGTATNTERERARKIVTQYGRSSLAFFTLMDDKSYYFSEGGSVVAYAVRGRVAVALGDPIGPPEDAGDAITAYRKRCESNDWIAAFYQTLPGYLDQYHANGFDALGVGQEAVVRLDTFTLEGTAMKGLRNAYNKVLKHEYTAEVCEPPIADDLIEELRAVSDEWLSTMHGSEKRFSLGWFEDDYIRGCSVIVVRDETGAIRAFANLVPEFQRNEATIDLMRRRSEVVNGTMEFLFVSLFQWCKEKGYESFNLGLSPMAGIGKAPDDPTIEKAMAYVGEHVNQFYNFKGLHAFKQKFDPEWEPRYLVYPSPSSLPAIALAIISADSGDHFIWDHIRGILGKRRARTA